MMILHSVFTRKIIKSVISCFHNMWFCLQWLFLLFTALFRVIESKSSFTDIPNYSFLLHPTKAWSFRILSWLLRVMSIKQTKFWLKSTNRHRLPATFTTTIWNGPWIRVCYVPMVIHALLYIWKFLCEILKKKFPCTEITRVLESATRAGDIISLCWFHSCCLPTISKGIIFQRFEWRCIVTRTARGRCDLKI